MDTTMTRIDSYEDLTDRIVRWLKDYYWQYSIKAFVVGVSGGIDSAVVSSLCARTGLPTYVVCMPLLSTHDNSKLSDDHAKKLAEKYENVTRVMVELSSVYDQFVHSVEWWSDAQGHGKKEFTSDDLTNANTKARIRMVTLYQIAGSKGGIVVGTGNKVEDYGVGFFTKYGDGGVDIAPIADLYKTEVWELGEYLEVDQKIVDAPPTDGLWDDKRTDEDQLGATYEQLEEAMENGTGVGLETLEHFNKKNQHKMQPIPTFTL
jgi:NAD+ synthase